MRSKAKTNERRARAYRACTFVGAGFLMTFGVGFLMWPGALHAEDAALPDAATILDKYVEVTGGRAAYEKIHNRVIRERVVHVGMGFEDKATMYTAGPNKRYVIIESDAFGELRRGTDGDVVWSLDDRMGPQLDAGNARAANLATAAFDRAVNWRKYYKKAESVGREVVDGKTCYKVILTPNVGDPETLFYDEQSGLLVKFIKSRPSSFMPTIPITVTLSDYREVDGILLPHKMRQSYELCGNKMEMAFVTESIEHNVDLPPDPFVPPDEILALAKKSTPLGDAASAPKSILTGSKSKPCGAGKSTGAPRGKSRQAKPAPCGDGRTAAPARTVLLTPTVSVPMKNWGGRPVVEARINGKGPFKLLIDTGTSFPVVLNDALVSKLKLPATGTTRPRGEAEDLDIVDVGTLTIGGAEFSSVQGIRDSGGGCASITGEGIQGILGLPLFEGCLLTLDFRERRVRFESGKLPKPDGETIEYSADEDHDYGVTVTLSVAGVPVKAHLDTGSPALVTVLNKLQKKLPLKGKPRVVGMARTPQGEVEVRSAVLDGVLKIGKHEWAQPRIDFADLRPMLDHNAGNIGSRLLKDFAVTVDQKNHRVRFRRGGGGGE